MIFLHCGLLFLCLNCVRTTSQYAYDYGLENSVTEYDRRYSFWPSLHNAARIMRLRKRDTQNSAPVGQSEGGAVGEVKANKQPEATPSSQPLVPLPLPVEHKDENKNEKQDSPQVPASTNDTNPVITPVVTANETATNSSATTAMKAPNQLDLNNPGVLKRGVIVFGGFLLLAVAYFIFYRRKGNKTDTNNTHNSNDVNQFRYGVLQSEDRRDNLELSRVPLTMESDDEEEDEDLEIFDLEQKRKSLSYVNLGAKDEDIVFENRSNDKDTGILLEIEDASTDTLINWSNNGNKSIL